MIEPEEMKLIREKVGLSRQRFAAILGLSVSTLHRWEHGFHTTSMPVFVALYEALEECRKKGVDLRALAAKNETRGPLHFIHDVVEELECL